MKKSRDKAAGRSPAFIKPEACVYSGLPDKVGEKD
jgi:hypothetical protein